MDKKLLLKLLHFFLYHLPRFIPFSPIWFKAKKYTSKQTMDLLKWLRIYAWIKQDGNIINVFARRCTWTIADTKPCDVENQPSTQLCTKVTLPLSYRDNRICWAAFPICTMNPTLIRLCNAVITCLPCMVPTYSLDSCDCFVAPHRWH